MGYPSSIMGYPYTSPFLLILTNVIQHLSTTQRASLCSMLCTVHHLILQAPFSLTFGCISVLHQLFEDYNHTSLSFSLPLYWKGISNYRHVNIDNFTKKFTSAYWGIFARPGHLTLLSNCSYKKNMFFLNFSTSLGSKNSLGENIALKKMKQYPKLV